MASTTPTGTMLPTETPTPTQTDTPTTTPEPTFTPWPSWTPWPTATQGVAPSNDDIDSALLVSYLPYTASIDTTGATVASDDPNMGSNTGVNSNTVWFRYVALAPGSVQVSTVGSTYDTVLAVYTGS
ncbi:MAG TPA: hypothetical protein VHS06_00240, partial [Chloroflexota bacterium]|nr:hypothetical protein [Chloroflexota bacterium]